MPLIQVSHYAKPSKVRGRAELCQRVRNPERCARSLERGPLLCVEALTFYHTFHPKVLEDKAQELRCEFVASRDGHYVAEGSLTSAHKASCTRFSRPLDP